MINFILTHKIEILITLAILAGVWRVIDGRGKLWLPLPTLQNSQQALTQQE